MKQNKGISLIKLVIIVVAIIIAIELLILIVSKIKQSQKETEEGEFVNTSTMDEEQKIISNIESSFSKIRDEFLIKKATINEYQPSYAYIDTDSSEKGTAFDLKNIIVSELGENVIDESKDKMSEVNLDSFKLEEGGFIDIENGYHVYLSNGENEGEKFITIVYKDDTFNHGMAYYDTENNLVSDITYGTYPILVAQIRLTTEDVSYYLEPIQSVIE